MNDHHEHCIDVCNSLLRGELSAVETYDQAIEKYDDEPIVAELQRIRREHAKASARLAENVRSMGGVPDHSSGAWGTFTQAIQGAANLLGADSAVESLRQGEQKGQKDYEDALDDDEVMMECKGMIRDELLPRIHQHISTLEHLGHDD